MRHFLLQDATLFVRPNMRRNGFDIKLKTRLGILFFTECEAYARPGYEINNVGEAMPEPDGIPIIFIPEMAEMQQNIHEPNDNFIVHEINPNDRIIIQNDEIIIEPNPQEEILIYHDLNNNNLPNVQEDANDQ